MQGDDREDRQLWGLSSSNEANETNENSPTMLKQNQGPFCGTN